MAWPTLERIRCHGFSRTLLPFIAKAIDDKKVEWGDVSMFASSCSADFLWAGCQWTLTESFETVDSVRYVSGDINNEELTFLILKG